jgi:DNA invertase Pin-like site-specific DNA recombinase
MAAIIGYTRLGGAGLDLDAQADALRAAGAREVFEDHSMGRDRPGWQACLEHLRDGNTLIVTDLTRIGHGIADLARIVDELRSRRVALRSLAEPWLDTDSAHGTLIQDIFAFIGAYERTRLNERTREGLAAARARGRRPGRPTVMTPEKSAQARNMRNEGMTLRQIADALSVAPGTILRELAEQNASGDQ